MAACSLLLGQEEQEEVGSPLAAVVLWVHPTRLPFSDLLTLVIFQQLTRDAGDAGWLVFMAT